MEKIDEEKLENEIKKILANSISEDYMSADDPMDDDIRTEYFETEYAVRELVKLVLSYAQG